MSLHQSLPMMFLGALVTQQQLFILTKYLSSFILAIHALELIFDKLLLSADGKADLVFNDIPIMIIHHIVILKGLSLLVLKHNRVDLTRIVPHRTNSA